MEQLAKSPGHRQYLQRQAQRVAGLRSELEQRFPDPAAVTLEIGCGHGHFLTAFAEQHPQVNCIGIDLVSRRIRKANAKRDKRGLDRLLFIKADVREFLMAWPERLVLNDVFILFPDPWPKKKHVKNRILQPALLDDLARFSSDDTRLHFRTDHEQNFAYGLQVIASHAAWRIDDELDWPFENPSFFQDLFTEFYSLSASFAG